MLWQQYVFTRGNGVHDLWSGVFRDRRARVLYLVGRGFDLRAQKVMEPLITTLTKTARQVESADLILIDFAGYELSDELKNLTNQNAAELVRLFSSIGKTETVHIGFSASGEDDISANNALRTGTDRILERVQGYTDIILDVSTLPRVIYVTLVTGLLQRLIADKEAPDALFANGVNLQLLVAEDPVLDSRIHPQDPSNELILIPGYASALQAESMRDWPMVWLPILGENRVAQLEKVLEEVPPFAEICPVLPHPARDLRRADQLLSQYRRPLFDARLTPTSNILYAHETHPFEAYRQLLRAMKRYRESLSLLGGCRLVVTPLGSKLVTLGASLACYEMRPKDTTAEYAVAIPYSEPRRYLATVQDILNSKSEICSLLVTGEAYATDPSKSPHDLHEPDRWPFYSI